MNLNYEFVSDKTVESVLKNLKKFGIAVVPSYLTEKTLSKLNSEFHNALYEASESIYTNQKHPTNTKGRAARLDPRHQHVESEFPNIAAVFSDDFMREVAHEYYSPHKHNFNESVFITNEFPCKAQILPWHFDRVQSLKFWFNLTDTTKNDGAMEYCPGTHWEGKYRAGYHLSQGLGIEDIPNDIEEDLIRNPVAIELNAGDLMIFDADGFHRGGLVGDGGERRVLRAHTYPSGRRYGDGFLTAGWWLRSPLNLNRWFRSASSRLIGEKVKEHTQNRKKHDISKYNDGTDD